jgi:hypothetical protein
LSNNNGAKQIPLFLNYTNPDGTTASIKTRVIKDFQNVQPQVGGGGMMVNEKTRASFGTIGCVLMGKNHSDLYVVTCNHVLTAGRFLNPGNLGDEADDILLGSSTQIGKWVAGIMNNQVDAAIVRIDDPSSALPNKLSSGEIYLLTETDQGVTQVELNGTVSSHKSAYIIHINQPFLVDYEGGNTVEVDGLFTLSAGTDLSSFSPVTKKGDSGALIYNSDTIQPVGIVLGANDQFTFGIPMNNVLNAFPDFTLTVLTN